MFAPRAHNEYEGTVFENSNEYWYGFMHVVLKGKSFYIDVK